MMIFLTSALSLAAPQDIIDPRPDGWIVDEADILDEEMEARLNERIAALEQDTTVEIIVVTIDDTEMVPKEYATTLFNHSRIGKEASNNGLLVLMVMGQRRLEMETGYGMEQVLTDSWLGTMQAEMMVPQFRAGNFGAGIEAGIVASDEKIRENAVMARLGTQADDIEYPPWPSSHSYEYGPYVDTDMINLGSFGGMGMIGLIGMSTLYRRRRRTCPDCKIYMPKVSEAEEDKHLDAGQEKEEEIGSASWSVHCCQTCDVVRTFSRYTTFSGYKKCGKCKYRTSKSSRKTISRPTRTSTGLATVTSSCKHCGAHSVRNVTLSKLPPPSSSSSSSRSSSSRSYSSSRSSSRSYGGGRSRGGGAGSSW